MTLTTNVRSKLACVTTAALLLPLVAPATAAAAAMMPKSEMSFWEAMSSGDSWMNFRPRYEYVSQDNAQNNANALTFRTMLGYKTAPYKGFVGTLEFSNNARLTKNKNYNDTVAGDAAYSVVADPASSVINRANVAFNGFQDTTLTFGRQYINLDNMRYAGFVIWRQTAQRFDALRVENTSLPNTKIDYTYSWNVERIFGVNAVAGFKHYQANTHLLNVSYEPAKWGKFIPYAYLVDNKNVIWSSADTYGLRFTGESSAMMNDMSVFYTAEYADQKFAHSNPRRDSHKYMNFELGAKNSKYSAMIGYEVLGGNGTTTFQTPYSTIHLFNGWADLFINQNPASSNALNGIKDLSFTVKADIMGWNAMARYHDLKAENMSMKYGTEWNFQVDKQVHKNVNVLVKYADYRKKDVNDNNLTVDTKKFWLQTTFSFS